MYRNSIHCIEIRYRNRSRHFRVISGATRPRGTAPLGPFSRNDPPKPPLAARALGLPFSGCGRGEELPRCSNTLSRSLGWRRSSRSLRSPRQRADVRDCSEHMSTRSLSMAKASGQASARWQRTEVGHCNRRFIVQLEQGCGRRSDHGTPTTMPCAIAFVSLPALGAICRTYYGAPCSAELLKLDLSARLILDCFSSRSLAESHKSGG